MESRWSQNRPQNFPPSRDFSTAKHNKRFPYGTAWSGWINLQTCRQLHPDPDLGPLKHDHKLTLIFFSLYEGFFRMQNPWIKRGDPTVTWPRDWLPKEEGLGDNIWCCPSSAAFVTNSGWISERPYCKSWSWSTFAPTSMPSLVLSWVHFCLQGPLVISSRSLFAFQCMFYFTLASGRVVLQNCYLLQKMIWIIANLLIRLNSWSVQKSHSSSSKCLGLHNKKSWDLKKSASLTRCSNMS
jgi:hypothetical protein